MKKNIFLSIIILFTCAGMPGMPGHITESTSKFDNSKQLTMEPAWVGDGPIKFSLFKSTKMPKDTLILEAIIKGIESISQGNSLHFNVDGTIYDFKSIDDLTDFEVEEGWYRSTIYVPPASWSSKRYIIDTKFLNLINSAKNVIVKLNLKNEFVESEFSKDNPTAARPAFKKFYEKMKTL